MDSDHSSNTSSSTEHSPTKAARFSVSSPTSSQASSAASSPGTHKRRAGRKKFRETRHPVYRGVRERNGGKWVCEVREPQKKTRIWLGTYATPEMAGRAHDVAALALRGESAPLNFPDSVWAIPRAASSSVEDIRLAAAEAAERHRPAWAAAAGPGTSVSPRQRRLSGAVAPAAVEEPAPAVREAPASSGEVAAGFLDEEALFNMPGLLASMAEGMLLTPPGALQRGFDWDDVDGYVDMSLWRH